MNERIKELYQQAHTVRHWPANDPMRGGNPPEVYWQGEVSAQRFAELIVKECADLYDKSADNCWVGTATKDILKQYSIRIKKHFGVEE